MVLRPLVDVRFQVLFHLRLTGLLFTFRSRYFCAIGRPGVLSLGRWASRLQVGFHVSGLTWETVNREPASFAYGPITLYGAPFQVLQLDGAFVTLPQGPASLRRRPPQPRMRNAQGLTRIRFRLFPFRSPLLRESRFFFFSCGYLDVSVPRVRLRTLCIQMRIAEHYLGWVAPFGNPRIKASGSSPGLIAASHVLHRLWAPRHPPHTLRSLTATIPALSSSNRHRSLLLTPADQMFTRR